MAKLIFTPSKHPTVNLSRGYDDHCSWLNFIVHYQQLTFKGKGFYNKNQYMPTDALLKILKPTYNSTLINHSTVEIVCFIIYTFYS